MSRRRSAKPARVSAAARLRKLVSAAARVFRRDSAKIVSSVIVGLAGLIVTYVATLPTRMDEAHIRKLIQDEAALALELPHGQKATTQYGSLFSEDALLYDQRMSHGWQGRSEIVRRFLTLQFKSLEHTVKSLEVRKGRASACAVTRTAFGLLDPASSSVINHLESETWEFVNERKNGWRIKEFEFNLKSIPERPCS